jgi:TonB family protein
MNVMKKAVFIFLCFLLQLSGFSQKDTTVYAFLDTMPEFVGGFTGMNNYFKQKIKYPKKEMQAGITGKVYLQFVVKSDGTITNIKELKGINNGTGLTKEAIRVVKKMPQWNPGIRNGVPVNVKMTLPVIFSLNSQTHTIIDDKASSIPDSITTTTQGIANYIISNFEGENDRVRAIFVWVGKNIEYDIDNMFSINFNEKDEVKISKALKSKKGICIHYALLFQDVCTKMGIKSYVVSGYTEQNGVVDQLPHAWCAAFINYNWYMFDPTFGSGYIDENGKFIKKDRNDFFKIPPRNFVASHQPFDYMWQFLYYPVSSQDFYNNKTQLDTTKPFFNYTDSISSYDKLTTTEQLIATARRMEANGINNMLIKQRLTEIYDAIKSYKKMDLINEFNAAVADYNDGIYNSNELVYYRNKQFKPMKSDSAIQAMITIIDLNLNNYKSKIDNVKQKIKEYDGMDVEFINLVQSQEKSFDQFLQVVNEQREFVKKYLKKSKTERKLAFGSR